MYADMELVAHSSVNLSVTCTCGSRETPVKFVVWFAPFFEKWAFVAPFLHSGAQVAHGQNCCSHCWKRFVCMVRVWAHPAFVLQQLSLAKPTTITVFLKYLM